MVYRPSRMRFGAFLAPYHALRENPTLTIERDMQLVELLEEQDYDEAWVGEHHSAGFENIGSPEVFIAAVAQRTKRIRLGTGVATLPYHNPLMLADRIVQLDHQSRGRIMFGCGPGQLPGDAYMQGIDPSDQRRMMQEAIEVIVELFEGKSVTRKSDWFHLRDAKLQMLPYQSPRMEMATACSVTPNGPSLAGRYGMSMLSVAAGSGAGFGALPDHWRVYEETSAANGHKADRGSWRVVASVHIAETRQQAFDEVARGVVPNVLSYLKGVGGKFTADALAGLDTPEQATEAWSTAGLGPFGTITIGTPDDAIARIEEMQKQSGGFGTFLLQAHNAASWAATKNSYEMFARHVMPHFQGNDRRTESLDWSAKNSDMLINGMVKALTEATEKYAAPAE